MDEQKYLIVDNRQGFKDLTGDVKSIKSRGNLVDISFHNSEKTFAYVIIKGLNTSQEILSRHSRCKGNMDIEISVIFEVTISDQSCFRIFQSSVTAKSFDEMGNFST